MPGDLDDRLAAVDDALAAQSTADDGLAAQSTADDGLAAQSTADDGLAAQSTADDAREPRAGTDGGTEARGDFGGDDRPSDDAALSTGIESESSAGDHGPARADAVAAEVSALGDRVAELEAAVEALRGYAGSVRAVNDRVEERADAAVATTESLEDRVDQLERQFDDPSATSGQPPRGESPPAGDRARDGGPSARRAREPPGRRDRTVDSPRAGTQPGESTGYAGREGAWNAGDGTGRNPRTPYGAVDAADSTEDDDGGLLARLRDAL